MKKTTTISLAKRLFHIEEDAYTVLENYLVSVRTHFVSHGDKEEILEDVENRIADHFTQERVHIITMVEVESVIEAMGSVGQFDADGSVAPGIHKANKRLYRDSDARVLAGVASGLGYYLGVDRSIIRALFILSIFFGGFGIFAYLVMWIATPLARGSAQKLEMHGVPVTLKTMSEVVRERIEEIDEKRIEEGAKNLGSAIKRSATEVMTILGPLLRILFGILVTVGSLILVAALTVFACLLLFGVPAQFFGPGATTLLSGVSYGVAVIALYGALVLPVAIMLLWGISILRKKNLLTRMNAWVWAGIWFVALVVAGVLVSRLAYNMSERIKNDPMLNSQSVVRTLEPFTALRVSDAKQVDIVIGDEYKIEFTGAQADIDRTSATIVAGTLSISGNDALPLCLFCPEQDLSITLTVPTLASLYLEDAARVDGGVNASTLTVILHDVSQATLSGSATALELTVSGGTHFDGATFPVRSARVLARDTARVTVNADTILVVEAHDASRVAYSNTPEVSSTESGAAQIEPVQEKE